MAEPISEILDSLRRIVQALRSDSKTFEQRLGISGAQLFVLKTLAQANALSINELSEETFTHQSSVSLVVAKLERQEFVTRRPGRRDARRTEVCLTARGKALLEQATSTVQEKLRSGLEGLTRRQRVELSALLSETLHRAGLGQEDAPMFFEESTHGRNHGKRTQ